MLLTTCMPWSECECKCVRVWVHVPVLYVWVCVCERVCMCMWVCMCGRVSVCACVFARPDILSCDKTPHQRQRHLTATLTNFVEQPSLTLGGGILA